MFFPLAVSLYSVPQSHVTFGCRFMVCSDRRKSTSPCCRTILCVNAQVANILISHTMLLDWCSSPHNDKFTAWHCCPTTLQDGNVICHWKSCYCHLMYLFLRGCVCLVLTLQVIVLWSSSFLHYYYYYFYYERYLLPAYCETDRTGVK